MLVDRIRIAEPERCVIGTKRVSAGEWWCDPDLPTAAAMPFGLIIEALAQTSGALLRDLIEDPSSVHAYFMGVNRARLRRRARVGDELSLEVKLEQWRGGICRTRARAMVDGSLGASAVLTTAVRTAL